MQLRYPEVPVKTVGYMFDVDKIRADFPALQETVYGRPLVYFDNAATSQKPYAVIRQAERLLKECNANIHRGVHRWAEDATMVYEQARESVRNFIGAASKEEIVFTSGATAGINLVASSFCERFVSKGDIILVSAAEHHSNIVSWQLAAMRKGAALRVIPVCDDGTLDLSALDRLLDGPVRIVAVTHISNVLGVVNPVEEIIRAAHERNIPVLIDGAQGIVHRKPDVRRMDCDFYVFSGHKAYALTGTGVVYGKRCLLEEMPPYMGGGEMVGRVTFGHTTYAPLPLKFEAGTPNFTGQSTFTPALEYAAKMCSQEASRYVDGLTAYMYERLVSDPRIRLFGAVESGRIPLFSFVTEGIHHEDLALVLDKMGIAVRSGQLCAEPLMDRFGVTGMLRVSLLPYNTKEEVDFFMESLDKAIKMLG